MDRVNVAVLMGGKSEEREVSLSTGRMIMNALDPRKYNAFAVDSALVGGRSIAGGRPAAIASSADADTGPSSTGLDLLPFDHVVHPNGSHPKPDVVFIALHGRFGEDGTVQGLLELLEIPYVGSGVLASALAMNKIMTRKVMQFEGIPVPRGVVVRRGDDIDRFVREVGEVTGYPVVVKPNEQGSTIGISIVRSPADLTAALEDAFRYDSEVLAEAFVEGVEITCAVLGNSDPRPLPVVEIVPESGFYDYHAKYTAGATEEIVPARIPQAKYDEAQRIALASHAALGCRGMSRTDMIVAEDGIYVLEVNTIPGMTPTSLLPRAAAAAGIEFPELLDTLIGFAMEGK